MARNRRTKAGIAAAFAVLVMAGGCTQSAPDGQVVARVNGVEITRRELIFEIETDPALRSLEGSQAQRAALAALVARKLLAEAASRALLDRSPDFIAARRRMAEAMLADRFTDRLAAETRPVSQDAVDRFMAANPAMFAQRERVVLAQLAVPRNWASGLGPSIAAADRTRLEARCRAEPAKCAVQQTVVDSQTLEPGRAAELIKRPVGSSRLAAPEMSAERERIILETVVSRQPLPAPLDANRARAGAILQWQTVQQARAAAVDHLRSKAAVDYQPGFGP